MFTLRIYGTQWNDYRFLHKEQPSKSYPQTQRLDLTNGFVEYRHKKIKSHKETSGKRGKHVFHSG